MGISNTTTDNLSERREELAASPTAPNQLVEAGRRVRRHVVVHSVRTALAAMVSLVVARLFGLPEAYWAPITTLVITQSSLRETLSLSWHRFMGTALGALVGVIVAIQIGPNLLAFGAGVLVLGLLCALVGSDRTAYRFGAVTLAIVLLVPRINSAWHMAFHRFAGVSLGIGVALVLTVLWPESEDFAQGGMGFVQPNDSVTTGLQKRVERTALEVERRKFSPES
ncbi:MAG TPA: FUSC family protein [Candidatus Acidoferrum sp.]|nr:FUSC family protein [Candidatus Acidoferrum sp.]